MESAGDLRHPQSDAARAASELAGSDANGSHAGRLPGTQRRWRTRYPDALARLAMPRHDHHHVENPRSSCSLTPGVQQKIWVKISSRRERAKPPKVLAPLSPWERAKPPKILTPLSPWERVKPPKILTPL